MVKNKLNELLSKLQKFKVKKILVLEYKERSYLKIFHSSFKLIEGEAFKFMRESIIMKITSSASEAWIFIETIAKHSIKSLKF